MSDTPTTVEDEIHALRSEVHDLRRVVRNLIIIGAVAFLALCYFITRADDAHGATRDAAGDREASAPESQPRSHGGPEGSAAGLATTAAAPSDALRIRVSPRPASRSDQRQPIASKNPTANEVGKVEAHALFPEPWQSLAECESIGDSSWRAESSSTYRGYFQVLPSTWSSVGGSGDPADATPAEQLHRARLLQARSGWGQWPECSRRVGLR